MRRIVLLLIGLLLMAACGPSGAPVTPSAGGDTTTAVPPQASGVQPAAPITPAASPEEAGIVRPQDWTKGANDPLVTIIEYGDFQ